MSQILWFLVAIRDYDYDEDAVAHDINTALDDYGLTVWSEAQLTGSGRSNTPRGSGNDMVEIAAKLFSHYGDDAHILSPKEKELLQKKAAEMLAKQLADGP